jgi:GAF domain-containing protein
MAELDSLQRLSATSDAIASSEPDPALQQCVESVARALDVPIALVSVVVKHIQFFRAQVGLPPDLAVSCATSRSNSFCQFVVRGEEAFAVRDARTDARVPSELVEVYAIRAYLGVPLRHRGEVIGTLCAIDVRERDFSAEHRAALESIARAVEARFEQLAAQDEPITNATTADPVSTLARFRETAASLEAAFVTILPVVAPVASSDRASIERASLDPLRATLAQAVAFNARVGASLDSLEALVTALDRPVRERVEDPLRELRLSHREAQSLVRVASAFLDGSVDERSATRVVAVMRDSLAIAQSMASLSADLVRVAEAP